MTTVPEAPAVEPVNGSKPTLAPLAIFSPETVEAVTAPKPTMTRVKRSLWRRWLAVLATVWGDLCGAWFWDAAPPSISQVWRSRVVDYSAIPGGQHECVTRYVVDGSGGFKVGEVRRSGFWQLTCICDGMAADDRKKVNVHIRTLFALRWGWIAWNHLVAIPLTAVLYATAWILQRPSRTFLGLSTFAFLYGVAQATAEAAR
jgi:hypothetical protein